MSSRSQAGSSTDQVAVGSDQHHLLVAPHFNAVPHVYLNFHASSDTAHISQDLLPAGPCTSLNLCQQPAEGCPCCGRDLQLGPVCCLVSCGTGAGKANDHRPQPWCSQPCLEP